MGRNEASASMNTFRIAGRKKIISGPNLQAFEIVMNVKR